MTIQLNFPSKTFFCGEYSVLSGDPGIVLCHEPFFKCHIDSSKLNQPLPFPADSPAGRLWQQHSVGQLTMDFRDPHHGKGGFGASTAEFAAVYCVLNGWQPPLSTEQAYDLWRSYREITRHNPGWAPSGVDLLAQTQNCGLYWIHPALEIIEALPWPFPDWILKWHRTDIKLPTHQHLAELPTLLMKSLAPLVRDAKEALLTGNKQQLLAAFNGYQQALLNLGLVCQETQTLLSSLPKDPKCIAQKGCGALGADVILQICHA